MPYLNQMRVNLLSSRSHTLALSGDPAGTNRMVSSDTYNQDWKRDTIYGYRDKGLSDSGQSVRYEDLTGQQLRDEIVIAGSASSQYDTGHPCRISHDSVSFRGCYTTLGVTYGTKRGQYSGHVVWQPSNASAPYPYAGYLPSATPGWLSSTVMNGYGTRAIKRFQPLDRSSLNLLASLIELRSEGLPKLPTIRALNNARNVSHGLSGHANGFADEFLNAKFGWGPIVSDLKSLAELLISSHGTIEKWQKNSGVSKRAGGVLDVQSSTTAGSYQGTQSLGRWRPVLGSSPIDLWPSVLQSSRSTVHWVENYATSIRFSGAFQYYMGRYFDLSKNWPARAERLLGLELTPETVWEVMPWTWLNDWFNNIGGIISIASQSVADGSLMKYGYVCADTVATRSETSHIPLLNGGFWTSVVQSTSTRYQRERSSPYGFGTNPSEFSNSQWAVLGALGMTRATKVLRLREP